MGLMINSTKKAPVAATTDVKRKSNKFSTDNYITLDEMKHRRRFLGEQIGKEPPSSKALPAMFKEFQQLNTLIAIEMWGA